MVFDFKILDYGVTNLAPIMRSLSFSGTNVEIITAPKSKPSSQNEVLVLPGIGSWDYGKAKLDAIGASERICEYHSGGGRILGICLGMQLLAKSSEEGSLPGLGLIDCDIQENFTSTGRRPSVNNGWGQIEVFGDTEEKSRRSDFSEHIKNSKFYFSHSYSFSADAFNKRYPSYLSTSPLGLNFIASFFGDQIAGIQFHPERSHKHGRNFLKKLIESWSI